MKGFSFHSPTHRVLNVQNKYHELDLYLGDVDFSFGGNMVITSGRWVHLQYTPNM